MKPKTIVMKMRIPEETHEIAKKAAMDGHRTITEQYRMVLEEWAFELLGPPGKNDRKG